MVGTGSADRRKVLPRDSLTKLRRGTAALRTPFAVRAYLLALVSETVAGLLTHFTWPLLSRAPYALLFLGVYVSTRWGNRLSGVVATALAAAGSILLSGWFGPPPAPGTTVVFVVVALVGIHLIVGRNDAIVALAASEAQFRATWEHAALGAAVFDRQGCVERINPELERLLGHPPEAWLGRTFTTFTEDEDAAVEQRCFHELLADRASHHQLEHRYRHADGTTRWCRVTLSALRGPGGSPTGGLMALEDVTDHREAQAALKASEDKLRRSQKMEAVGQLVAGVAHNFNNLLTITAGYAELLINQPRVDRSTSEDRQSLEEIRRAAERGSALTRQLLAFSRDREVRAVPIDLNKLIMRMRPMLARAIREDIYLTIERSDDHATVLIDPDDLQQVVLNLVINARDALPTGGHIVIDIERQRFEDSDDASARVMPPGEYVRVRVQDDGTGMTPEVQAHLFEPFFTTKDVGQGTGLGLAFVYGTVQQHDGAVTVDSAPGIGTIFTLYFPLRAEAGRDEGAPQPEISEVGPARAATILLVEDEPSVRAVTARTLRRAGHRVLEAALPSDGVQLFGEHADQIDLLMTDLVMPEMSGSELADRLVSERPGLRVLFVSGYTDALTAAASQAPDAAVLRKPFVPSQLLDTVAEALSEPSA